MRRATCRPYSVGWRRCRWRKCRSSRLVCRQCTSNIIRRGRPHDAHAVAKSFGDARLLLAALCVVMFCFPWLYAWATSLISLPAFSEFLSNALPKQWQSVWGVPFSEVATTCGPRGARVCASDHRVRGGRVGGRARERLRGGRNWPRDDGDAARATGAADDAVRVASCW